MMDEWCHISGICNLPLKLLPQQIRAPNILHMQMKIMAIEDRIMVEILICFTRKLCISEARYIYIFLYISISFYIFLFLVICFFEMILFDIWFSVFLPNCCRIVIGLASRMSAPFRLLSEVHVPDVDTDEKGNLVKGWSSRLSCYAVGQEGIMVFFLKLFDLFT